MGKLVQLLSLFLLAPAALTAQSASNFTPTKGSPPAGATPLPAAKPVEPTPTDAEAIENRPSRYVGDDLDSYLATMTKSFAMKSRTTDPFGLVQEPSAKPVKPVIAKNNLARPATIPSVPYSEIVNQIRVTTVIPGEGRFLVGTRSFSQGDKFSISFRGKNYQTQVIGVSSAQIVFRNLENSETAVLKLDMMPPGMSRGTNGKITVPGMQPSHADTPLEIDGGGSNPAGIN